MHRIALTLLAGLTLSPAWGAGSGPIRVSPEGQAERFRLALQQLPPDVAASAKAYFDECQANGIPVTPSSRLAIKADLNEDSQPDYIIDTNELNAPCFCGSGGCAIEAWVSDQGGYVKAFDSNVRGWQLSPRGNLPPILIVDLHGTACGGVGADLCLKALIYRDGKLIDTTAGQ